MGGRGKEEEEEEVGSASYLRTNVLVDATAATLAVVCSPRIAVPEASLSKDIFPQIQDDECPKAALLKNVK